MTYDENNIFYKFITHQIKPDSIVYEDDHVLCFDDKFPKYKSHVLVIPKGKYVGMMDFAESASEQEQAALFSAIKEVAKLKGIDKTGFRVTTNFGKDANQEVMHFHFHVIGGQPLD